MRAGIAVALLITGCTNWGDALVSSDRRIDSAPLENDPESHSPRLCVSEDVVHVAWVDDREGADSLWYVASVDGGDHFTTPLRVDDGTGQVAEPSLACDGSLVLLVWEDNRDGELENPNIYASRSTDSGITWSENTRLSDDEDGESQSMAPALVLAGDRAYVAWHDNTFGAFDVLLSASANGGETWSAPKRLDGDDPGAGWSAWPQIVGDDQGHVVVVWEDARSGGSDIYARASVDGGTTLWPEVRIDGGDAAGENDSFNPRIAAGDNAVYVVWHDTRNGEKRDVFLNWSVNFGQNWATDGVRVDSDSAGFYDSINPDVAISGNSAFVVWQDARFGAYDAYVRQAQAGVFYEPEVRVDRDAPGAGNSLEVQVLREREVVVALWRDLRDDDGEGYNDLYYAFSEDAGLTWSEDDLRIDSLAPGTSYKIDVQAALSDEVLFAVWEDGRRGTSDIYFQALAVGQEAAFETE